MAGRPRARHDPIPTRPAAPGPAEDRPDHRRIAWPDRPHLGELLDGRQSPAIAAELPLILELQTEAWWQDLTVAELEQVRRRLRGLVHLIEKTRRPVLYTNFTDQIGEAAEIDFTAFRPADAFEEFRRKARLFLRQHENHVAILKLRTNRQLTPTDLAELERMLAESGVGDATDLATATAQSEGLGLFVRSLVGLDRAAVQQAFAEFLQGRTLRPNQHEFIEMLIEHLTAQGVVDIGRLYESPFTRWGQGVDDVFQEGDVDRIQAILDDIRGRAVA